MSNYLTLLVAVDFGTCEHCGIDWKDVDVSDANLFCDSHGETKRGDTPGHVSLW